MFWTILDYVGLFVIIALTLSLFVVLYLMIGTFFVDRMNNRAAKKFFKKLERWRNDI